MELHLKIIGIVLILLAFLHALFPRYFNWKQELLPLSLIIRQMFQVHTFFIALIVFLMGVLTVTSAQEIIETPLGNKIALGLCLFWSVRALVQFFGYSSTLWKGKKFETIVHILFSCLWLYISFVFFMVYWN